MMFKQRHDTTKKQWKQVVNLVSFVVQFKNQRKTVTFFNQSSWVEAPMLMFTPPKE